MRYKIALLGVLLGIAFVISTASAQEECPQTITVVAGTEIQLAATPVNQTVYRYLWDNSSLPTGVLVFNSTDLPWTEFNAPETPGEYTVTVTVTPFLAEACMNQTCINITTTSPTCPLCPDTVCVIDEPERPDCPPFFNYTGTEAPGYTYSYTINGAEVATTPDYTLDWSKLTQPTDAIPVVNSTVCFNLKDSAGQLLVQCCKDIRMVYEPKPVITHNP